jgi:hypothetical protein
MLAIYDGDLIDAAIGRYDYTLTRLWTALTGFPVSGAMPRAKAKWV